MKPNTVILGWPNSWRKREDDSTKVFVDTIRNAGAGKMALLVPKGIQRFPDTGDTVKVTQLAIIWKLNSKVDHILHTDDFSQTFWQYITTDFFLNFPLFWRNRILIVSGFDFEIIFHNNRVYLINISSFLLFSARSYFEKLTFMPA